MIVIPAVDIRGGRCVRLQQGDPARETVFEQDPVAAARRWSDAGAELIHVVDLDGALDGVSVNAATIEAIGAALPGRVQVGGGIRAVETAERYLAAGVRRVVVGTRAAEDAPWLRETCAALPGRVCVGIDARDGFVAVRGWQEITRRRAADLLAEVEAAGAAAVIYTDIARDGMLSGPNVEATRRLAEAATVPVIASGGVSRAADVRALRPLGLEGVIVGRALYGGCLTFEDARQAARDPGGG
jgi:phosphoribosylformimino-5-aminoimidazole carboxamide ribotide isomerase